MGDSKLFMLDNYKNVKLLVVRKSCLLSDHIKVWELIWIRWRWLLYILLYIILYITLYYIISYYIILHYIILYIKQYKPIITGNAFGSNYIEY